jgi:hypothetical protein
MIETTTVEPIDPVLQELTMGLLSCSSQIAAEAAATFYRSNTFKFAGDDTWQPLYAFLSCIGDRNTSYLRDLEVGVSRSADLQADRFGLRDNRWGWPFGKVYPRCASETESILEQIVENSSPAIRYCFRALGKDGSALTLRVVLERGHFPVSDPWCFCAEEHLSWDSFWEIPVQVERLRREYSGDRVAVTWEGCVAKDVFGREGDLNGLGWELVDAKEEGDVFYDQQAQPESAVSFKLRRK